jgi:hypothetical protein
VALIALSGGIAFGLSTWRLAARDLAMMRKGLMDSGGLLATVQASGEGLLAFALNGMLALISVGVLFGTKG